MESIDAFLDEAAKQLHDYIHCPIFKATILKDGDKIPRLSIAKELDSRIVAETMKWQKKCIENIFYESIMKRLAQHFQNIHQKLHSIKDEMRGIKTPYDGNNKTASVFLSCASGTAIVGGVVMTRMTSDHKVLLSVAAAAGVVGGLFVSAMSTFEVLDDSQTVCINAYEARMKAFTEEKIRVDLKEIYAKSIQKIIEEFLEGDLKDEIHQIKLNITTMQGKRDFYKGEKENMASMQSTVNEALRSLHELERLEVDME